MANVEELTVGGYIFASYDDAEAAKNEIKRIAYIESHVDMTNVSVVKQVYEKSLENRTFATPIGLEYMHSLYNILSESGIDLTQIKPIPLYSTFHRVTLASLEEPRKRRITKAQKAEMTLKMKYRNAVLVAVILGILAFSMLIITLNGSTMNAINYKRAVTNEYASWEQELKEREQTVRDKERELGINFDE